MPSGDRQHSANKISVLGERRRAPARLLGCNKMAAAAAPTLGKQSHFSVKPYLSDKLPGSAATHTTLHHDACCGRETGRRADLPHAHGPNRNGRRAAANTEHPTAAGLRRPDRPVSCLGTGGCSWSQGCAAAPSGARKPERGTEIAGNGQRATGNRRFGTAARRLPAPRRPTGMAGEVGKRVSGRLPTSAEGAGTRPGAAPLLPHCRKQRAH